MLERLSATRIVASPEALDGLTDAGVMLRLAPDEALILDGAVAVVADPHAIVEPDAGWSGVWVAEEKALAWLATAAAWPVPAERPCLVQGMAAELPVKVWLDGDRALLLVPSPLAADLAERLPEAWR